MGRTTGMAQSDWTDALRGSGPSAVTIDLHVEPGSSRPGLAGYDPWRRRLRLKVRAPPRGGEATGEAVEAIALLLGVAPSRVVVVAGATSRHKTVRVEGLTLEAARDALAPHVAAGGDPR
jgi:uncharacterized protein (TIGR00251 family)